MDSIIRVRDAMELEAEIRCALDIKGKVAKHPFLLF